jgi:hypothetical protein
MLPGERREAGQNEFFKARQREPCASQMAKSRFRQLMNEFNRREERFLEHAAKLSANQCRRAQQQTRLSRRSCAGVFDWRLSASWIKIMGATGLSTSGRAMALRVR